MTSLSLGQYIKAWAWHFPVMPEWKGLISYLLYGLFSAILKKNAIKITGSFQHPLAGARGDSRSCLLNRCDGNHYTVSLTMRHFLALLRQDLGQI